ncbi:MAG TPA: hypothetical protein VHK65_10275 [Candidatus Dormibacteraeota bacterium]|nr:hypothetical protein [Candidatus Dormibacteraeota bacterium]
MSWPRFPVSDPLNCAGRRDRVGSAGKNGKYAVPFAALLQDRPAVRLDGGSQKLIVAINCLLHSDGVLLPSAGGSLNVR